MKTIAIITTSPILIRHFPTKTVRGCPIRYIHVFNEDCARGIYFDGYLDFRESVYISDEVVELVKRRCK